MTLALNMAADLPVALIAVIWLLMIAAILVVIYPGPTETTQMRDNRPITSHDAVRDLARRLWGHAAQLPRQSERLDIELAAATLEALVNLHAAFEQRELRPLEDHMRGTEGRPPIAEPSAFRGELAPASEEYMDAILDELVRWGLIERSGRAVDPR